MTVKKTNQVKNVVFPLKKVSCMCPRCGVVDYDIDRFADLKFESGYDEGQSRPVESVFIICPDDGCKAVIVESELAGRLWKMKK